MDAPVVKCYEMVVGIVKDQENEQKRRMVMKVTMGLSVLLMLVGCQEKLPERHKEEEVLNEVIDTIMRIRLHGVFITCIEQKGVPSDSSSKEYNVYLMNAGRVLQTYRIENNKVLNVRSLKANHLGSTTTHEEYRDAFVTVLGGDNKTKITSERIIDLFSMLDFTHLPNMLNLNNRTPLSFESSPTITMVDMNIYMPLSQIPPNRVYWNNWLVRKWTGTPDETPIAIKAFCQSMMEIEAKPSPCEYTYFLEDYPRLARIVASLPDIGNYPAYLRAVPLFTWEEIEAEKDVPFIELDKTRKNVHYAVQYPYTLFPIPPNRSPFPAVRKYTPGDKFRVSYGNGLYLIETFIGEDALENKKQK